MNINSQIFPVFKQAYTAVSIAFLIPIICWPFVRYLGLEPAWGTTIEKNWLISASLLLITFTVCDSFLSKQQGMYDLSIRIIWVLFSCYMVIISLQDLALAWFLAATVGLRALWVSCELWHHPHVQWWQWQAWFRDSSAAFTMFVWLMYW
ncbi:MAG: hypothetical protein Q9M10_02660 [Mariprofundaceae bacterium]|nr:hypothetical protein [Mariprofundaceae bacterium]